MSSWWLLLLGIPLMLGVGYCRDRRRVGPARANRTLLWHCGVLAGLYVVALVVLIFIEDRLVYIPIPYEKLWTPAPGLNYEEVTIPGPDSSRIQAWWCPQQGAKWTFLFSHGSGGNLSLHTYLVPALQKSLKANVLAYAYPGYSGSTGSPCEAGCYAASEAAYDWLITTKHTVPDHLILFGQSMGGAMACDLARKRPHRALILLSTFTSLRDCGQELLPIFPVKWLMRHNFECIDKLSTYSQPLLIGHGDADTLVPFHHGEDLFAAAASPHKVFYRCVGGTHVLSDRGFFDKIRELVDGLETEQ